MAPEIYPTNLETVLASSDRVVVVDLYDDTCTPCITQERFTDVVALDLREAADVYRINLAQAPDFLAHHGVAGLPTIVMFKGGRLRQHFPGLTDPGSLAAAAKALAREI